MALIERSHVGDAEPLVIVEGPRLKTVVVHADFLVGVPDSEVELEVVVEDGFVGGEIEPGQLGLGYMELDQVDGAEDEPEDEGGDADGDEDREDDFKEEFEETAAAVGALFPRHDWILDEEKDGRGLAVSLVCRDWSLRMKWVDEGDDIVYWVLLEELGGNDRGAAQR